MATYEANIRIGVQGQRDLDAAIKQIEGLQKAVRRENRLQIRLDQGVAQSLANYNKELTKASNLLNRVGAGSKFEAAAVQQYVSALGQANAARARQNKLIEDQTRAVQGLASASEREIEVLKRRNQISSLARPAGSANAVSAERRKAEQQLNRAAPGTDAETKAVQRLTAAIDAENKALERRNQLLGKTPAGGAAGGAGAGGRAAAQARSRLLGTISSGVIGGGFPLLFGQGAGAGAGGALGGLLGGALGGAGGFAGGILGSLIGTQLDKLAQGATAAGNALKDPVEGLQALKDAAVFAGKEQEFLVDKLIALGRISEAQAIIQQQIIEKIGVQGNNDLLALADSSTELAKAWGELSLQMQAALAGPLADMLKWIADLIKLAGGLNRDNAARNDMLSGLSPQDRQAYQNRRTGIQANAGFGFKGDGTLFYDSKAKELAALDAEFKKRSTPPAARTEPLNPANIEKQLDAAVARQKELVDLQRQGEDLVRANTEFRRDQEEQIAGLRKKAADYDRDVTRFRKEIEDKIADKREENARRLIEITRQQRQNAIERLDQTLEPVGRILAEQGGGRAQSVDLAREYIRTIAEGQADLLEKEQQAKLDIARVQRDADKFSLDVADKVKQFSDRAADYAKEVEKFKYETAKKVVDLQRQAADYTYAQWERVYKLAADVQQKAAAAAESPLGPVSIGQVGANAASIAKTLADALSLTPAQAAGIVGNFQRESGLNPRINEGGAVGLPRGVGGYGLAQWTGGRQTDLVRFAGGPSQAGDLRTQVRFVISELLGPESNALRQLRRTSSPEEAAVNFDRFYERSGIKALGERQANARAVYNQIAKGGATSLPAAAAAVPIPVATRTAAEVAGAAPKPPTALPLTGVPSALARPDVTNLLTSYKGLTEESRKQLELLQEQARIRTQLAANAAKTRLTEGVQALNQQILQPLLDANQALEDRAAYQREYGELLQVGVLPALAEQLAQSRELEAAALRQNKVQSDASLLAEKELEILIKKAEAAGKNTKELEAALAIQKEITAALGEGSVAIATQADRQEQQLQALESPEARRQGAINKYNERINTLKDPNRLLETQLDAKARLAELSDPLNQLTTAANSFGDAFGQAFQDIVTGSKSASEALGDMFSSIGASFAQMAAQMLAQQAVLGIISAFTGGLGADPFARSRFGGRPQLFAEGGIPPVGKASIVGEDGPELFIPGVSGTIVPNDMVVPYSEGKATINPDGSTTYNASYPGAPGAPGSRGASGIGGQGRAGNSPLPALTVPFQKGGSGDQTLIQNLTESFGRQLVEMGSIKVAMDTTVINGVEYATTDQVNAATQQGAQQGAKIALAALQNSVGTRRKIGL